MFEGDAEQGTGGEGGGGWAGGWDLRGIRQRRKKSVVCGSSGRGEKDFWRCAGVWDRDEGEDDDSDGGEGRRTEDAMPRAITKMDKREREGVGGKGWGVGESHRLILCATEHWRANQGRPQTGGGDDGWWLGMKATRLQKMDGGVFSYLLGGPVVEIMGPLVVGITNGDGPLRSTHKGDDKRERDVRRLEKD